jgi:hypothetical protein
MFDDLRKDAGSGDFADEEIERLFDPKESPAAKPAKSRASGKFLGMTAGQRFILSFLLLAATCLGGILVLLFAERVVFF